MKAIDRMEEEKRAGSLVEVFAAPAKRIQRCRLLQQLFKRKPHADAFKRLIPDSGIGSGNDPGQLDYGRGLESRL